MDHQKVEKLAELGIKTGGCVFVSIWVLALLASAAMTVGILAALALGVRWLWLNT